MAGRATSKWRKTFYRANCSSKFLPPSQSCVHCHLLNAEDQHRAARLGCQHETCVPMRACEPGSSVRPRPRSAGEAAGVVLTEALLRNISNPVIVPVKSSDKLVAREMSVQCPDTIGVRPGDGAFSLAPPPCSTDRTPMARKRKTMATCQQAGWSIDVVPPGKAWA